MWLILQHDKPDDFVIATGTEDGGGEAGLLKHQSQESRSTSGSKPARNIWCVSTPPLIFISLPHTQKLSTPPVSSTGKMTTVRNFCEMAFAAAGMPLKWEGVGVSEVRGVIGGGSERERGCISHGLRKV